ncbi:MAG: rhodanese-like domain-containing protein [Candidatus Nanoarchaeia archaeon]
MKKFNLLIKVLLAFILVLIIFLCFDLYKSYMENKRDITSLDGIENDSFNYSLITLSESLNDSKYIILDVREPEEYFARHLKGALNFRQGDIHYNEKTLEYLKDISGNKTFATYCHENRHTRGGDGRSAMTAQFLIENNVSAVVIEGGMRKFLLYRNIINENYFYSLGMFIFYYYSAQELEKIDSSCVIRFEKEKTIFETENKSHNFDVNSGFMTTHEWGKMMNLADEKSCTGECVDRPTCFYARLFGMRLDLQGGEFKGFVLDSD